MVFSETPYFLAISGNEMLPRVKFRGGAFGIEDIYPELAAPSAERR
jgi:hypothetical protein